MKRGKLAVNRHNSTYSPTPSSPVLASIAAWGKEHLNFYRVHLLAFIFVPILTAAIFYACRPEIPFIDCLFMVFSCATVTGLNSVLLHDLALSQQIILFFMMVLGSTSSVSVVTIVVRRHFFRLKLDHDAKQRAHDIESEGLPQLNSRPPPRKGKKKNKAGQISKDMIHRSERPVRVNQMNAGGWLREEQEDVKPNLIVAGPTIEEPESILLDESPFHEDAVSNADRKKSIHVDIDEPEKPTRSRPPRISTSATDHHPSGRRPSRSSLREFGRTKTVEFGTNSDHGLRHRTTSAEERPTRPVVAQPRKANEGYGGFDLFDSLVALVRKLRPVNALERRMTIPRTVTLTGTRSLGGLSTDEYGHARPVGYISFDAVVGRNSQFVKLTRNQREELGGLEYRALGLLLKIVVGYWFTFQMLSVLVLAPYLTKSTRFAYLFNEPETAVNPTWFTFFQVWSAFSNTGMSLIDASMIPFQRDYLQIMILLVLIAAGNTAFPIFLRLVIWTMSKISRSNRDTLQFLLDHPRRCYIYLFPSRQTWYLLFVLVLLNSFSWASFLILDIGNKELEAIGPLGTRVIDALFQSFAIRAAGFTIFPLSLVAPAVQFLIVLLMYIAVYPIALSIRASNVYEERSMGVFEDSDDEDSDEEEARLERKSLPTYIAHHGRKLLSFDLWWIVFAIWLICIIERNSIIDAERPFISIFSVTFEAVSGYATDGLSLGTPNKNTSLSGELTTLSKLVLIAVMVRGRHRGLPIAIDRSILLPSDIVAEREKETARKKSLMRRRGSSATRAESVTSTPEE